MGVVTGFIRSAGRMEERIFGLSWGLRASLAERLKPLTTHVGGRETLMCVVTGFIRSAGRTEEHIFMPRWGCVPRWLSG